MKKSRFEKPDFDAGGIDFLETLNRYIFNVEADLRREDLPAEIKGLRRLLHLDQKGLAAVLSVSQAAISDWEAGNYEPSAEVLIQLGNLTDSGPDAIYFWRLAGVDPERVVAAVVHLLRVRGPESKIDEKGAGGMSVASAADLLGVDADAVVSLIDSGKIKGRRVHPDGAPIVNFHSLMEHRKKMRESKK